MRVFSLGPDAGLKTGRFSAGHADRQYFVDARAVDTAERVTGLRAHSANLRFRHSSDCKDISMKEATQVSQPSSRAWQRIAISAFLVALLGLVVLSLPRGFDTDLRKIGEGKPAVVFVYDPNLLVSNQQTRELDAARESLGDALHFLIADVGRPEGQQFMREHQASATQLLLFAPDGRVISRMQGLVSSDQIINAVAAPSAGD
ncbi:MAG: hypothetical protein ACK5PG_13245 [Lysobacterales bacterium]|jgi:hypothetical protein